MFVIPVYVLVFVSNIIAAHGNDDSLEKVFSIQSRNADLVKLHPVTKEHREELKKLIKILNTHVTADPQSDSEVAEELNPEVVQVEEQVTRLRTLLKLLQKNYDYQVNYEKELEKTPGSRVHFIDNPEVLEDFERSLRSQQISISSESSESSDSDGSPKNQLSNYRREALTQIDDKDASREDRDKYNNEEDSLKPSDYFLSKYIAIKPRAQDILKEIRFPNRFKIDNGRGVLRNNVENKQIQSAEIYDSLHQDIKDELTWKKVKESHETFDRKRKEKVQVDNPKIRAKENIKGGSKIKRVRRIKKIKKYSSDDERDKYDSWANGNRNFKIKSKSRPKAPSGNYMNSYTQEKMSRPFGRTSIPYIGKKSIYEEEE